MGCTENIQVIACIRPRWGSEVKPSESSVSFIQTLAILWCYLCFSFQFYIQDTQSSNGTFVNNQKLPTGAPPASPNTQGTLRSDPANDGRKEVSSGDVVQFGVEVVEQAKKGAPPGMWCFVDGDWLRIVNFVCCSNSYTRMHCGTSEAISRRWYGSQRESENPDTSKRSIGCCQERWAVGKWWTT